MTRTEHKRQQKLAKRNKRATQVRRELQKSRNRSTLDYILESTRYPIASVYMNSQGGMSSITVLRPTPNGGMLLVGFLVDMYALGVKDAFINRNVDMELFREKIEENGSSSETPENALKCIQGAIDFANSIGISPHPDTELALQVFRGIDIANATKDFEYGKNGKAFYMQGLHDTPERMAYIMEKLYRHSGIVEEESESDLEPSLGELSISE